jgi:hypothetical protein
MALAGGAGLAGCVSRSSSGDEPTASPTETATRSVAPAPTATSTRPPETTTSSDEPSTATPSAGYDVSVRYVHLQYGLAYLYNVDSARVREADTPFVAASVDVTTDGVSVDPPSADEFALRAGTNRYEPAEFDQLLRIHLDDEGWYTAGHGLLLFELPNAGVDGDLRLTWPGGERAIGEGIAERVEAGPPELSASLSLPDTHDSADAPPVEVEVTNEGERPARFVGTVARGGPLVASTPVARMTELVAAGETVTLSVGDAWSIDDLAELAEYDAVKVGDDEPDVTYMLSFASGGEAESDGAEIRLVE